MCRLDKGLSSVVFTTLQNVCHLATHLRIRAISLDKIRDTPTHYSTHRSMINAVARMVST